MYSCKFVITRKSIASNLTKKTKFNMGILRPFGHNFPRNIHFNRTASLLPPCSASPLSFHAIGERKIKADKAHLVMAKTNRSSQVSVLYNLREKCT